MHRSDVTGQRLVAVVLLGCILFTFPVPGCDRAPRGHGGGHCVRVGEQTAGDKPKQQAGCSSGNINVRKRY